MAAPMEVTSGGEEREENRDICEDDKAKQIFSQYELFHRIFRHLPAKVLNTSCIVCKDWRQEVEKIKSCQKKISCMMYDSGKGRKHDDYSAIMELSKRIQNLPSEPKHVLLFSSQALYEGGIRLPASEAPSPLGLGSQPRPSPRPRAAKRPRSAECKASMLEFLRARLPRNAKIHGVSTGGVVGTDERIGSPQELDKYNVNAGSLLFLGDIPGVEVRGFSVDQRTETRGLAPFVPEMILPGYTQGMREVPQSVIHSITGIPEATRVRYVLFFRADQNLECPYDLSHALLTCYKHVVVAGAYVDQFIPEDEDAKNEDDPMATEPTVKGIAFCGDDIEVASVLIESTVRAKDRIDAKLKKLKETGIRVNKHTIGFMLACVGRGHHLHHTGNVEADIFKRHFPGVPLFGLFGNGEIGYDYLPDYTSPAKDSEHWVIKERNAEEDRNEDGNDNDGVDSDVTVWDFPEMQHSYSTVFVVLSLPSS